MPDKTVAPHSAVPTTVALGMRLLIALLIVALATGLAYVVLSLPLLSPGLTHAVTEQLTHSGVSNPVTAVLLNFRGYDTLLEMIVLLLALLGVWSTADTTSQPEIAPGPVLDTLARVMVPLLILVAAYLLWVGAHAPGGAFQAGSVLAAAGILLLLAGWRPHLVLPTLPLRLLLIAGPVTFIGLAVVTTLVEEHLLELPPAHAGKLIFMLETAATLSIAVTLTSLFLGGEPQQEVNK